MRFLLLSFMILSSVLQAGPIPKPKSAPQRASFVGVWKMRWAHSEHLIIFSSDGTYRCGTLRLNEQCSPEWDGHWKITNDVLKLTGRTLPPFSEEFPFTWYVDLLPLQHRGTIRPMANAEFSLTPLR